MVSHHRVHYLEGVGVSGKKFLTMIYLFHAAEITGINTVQIHRKTLVMIQTRLEVIGQVPPDNFSETTGVGGENGSGDGFTFL